MLRDGIIYRHNGIYLPLGISGSLAIIVDGGPCIISVVCDGIRYCKAYKQAAGKDHSMDK